MSFMILKSRNVEFVEKIWFSVTNICRIKFRIIFESMNATIFRSRFWNWINKNVHTCLNFFFLFESLEHGKFSTILEFFLFFEFWTSISIMSFFLTVIADYFCQISFFFDNYCRSFLSNFVFFFDFSIFFFSKV